MEIRWQDSRLVVHVDEAIFEFVPAHTANHLRRLNVTTADGLKFAALIATMQPDDLLRDTITFQAPGVTQAAISETWLAIERRLLAYRPMTPNLQRAIAIVQSSPVFRANLLANNVNNVS